MPAPSSPVPCLIVVNTDPPGKRYPETAWFYSCQFRVGTHLIVGMLKEINLKDYQEAIADKSLS